MTMRPLAHRPARVAVLLVLVLMVLAPILAQTVSGQSDVPSANAQVIAQGLTAPPAEKSAWRVVKQTIPTRLDAVPSVRMQASTGFLLSDDVDIFVVDQRTKLRSRLSPGEAQFVQSGANQTWASLDKNAGTAYTLELVDRDVADVAPGAELVYNSGSFTTPLGDYDLDLIRSDVAAGDKATIPASSYPMLILVTSGSVTITSNKLDDPVRLKTGEASAIKGDLTIKPRGDEPVTFVAAVLGDPITGGEAVPTVAPTKKATSTPKTDTKKKTPTPEATRKAAKTPTPKDDHPSVKDGSSIRIAVRLCAPGMTYFAINPAACARADGNFTISLITPDGSILTQGDASKDQPTFVRWSGLKAGAYVLVVDALPDGFQSYSLDGFICCTTNDGYTITLTKNELVDGTLYLFTSAWGVGAPPTAAPQPTAVAAQPTTEAPVNPDPGLDSDGDGVSDQLELDTFGTSPYLVDSDGDGLPDGTEAFGLNGWFTAPALWDTDGDGVGDGVELQNNTNPLDPSSR